MPNALRVLVNLPHLVEGYAVELPFCVRDLKGLRAVRGKAHLFERDQYDPLLGPVLIPQLEVAAGELGIPPDSIEQFVNRDHACGMAASGLPCNAYPRFQHPGAVTFRALGRLIQLLVGKREAAGAAARRFDHGAVLGMFEAAQEMPQVVHHLPGRLAHAARNLGDAHRFGLQEVNQVFSEHGKDVPPQRCGGWMRAWRFASRTAWISKGRLAVEHL